MKLSQLSSINLNKTLLPRAKTANNEAIVNSCMVMLGPPSPNRPTSRPLDYLYVFDKIMHMVEAIYDLYDSELSNSVKVCASPMTLSDRRVMVLAYDRCMRIRGYFHKKCFTFDTAEDATPWG